MAFHVACPITCRRICYCALGFPQSLNSDGAKGDFLDDVARVDELFRDPSLFRARDEGATVQVPVPKVAPPPPLLAADDDAEEMLSAQTKRVAVQKRAAAASMVAEDFARRVESGALMDYSKDVGEDQGQSNVKVMCRLCFVGENEGSDKARKMLPCKSCGKKYHRSCLKAWSQNRDLFHWSSWTCPSCRICEACRRTGDQTKFKFCRRCDAAYHCYCQQPPHKNVSSGPYLCPKHTKCHSCASKVPGNGNSVRWFLGYTCCDACGRLFVKGNYCPVCLKVYRDSEATPMVCCDVCQRWVHIQCDGISDEKYLQFQVDGNLQYKCPTCRGECYQVRDLEDAVQELWRRKDEEDRDLITSLRAAAGLPTQEEIFSISPYSDDEESGPITLRSEYGRSLKFSLKSLADSSPKKNKEHGKKSLITKNTKRKDDGLSVISKSEAHESFEGSYSELDGKNHDMQSRRGGTFSSTSTGITNEGICSINQAGVLKRKFIDEVTADNHNKKQRVMQIKSSTGHGFGIEDSSGKEASKPMIKNTTGAKLVIHFGGRNRNASPKSGPSVHRTEQELTTTNGSEDAAQEQIITGQTLGRHGKLGEKVDTRDQLKGAKLKGKESNLIKIKKINSDVSGMNPKSVGGNVATVPESVSQAIRSEKVYTRKNVDTRPNVSMDGNNDPARTSSGSQALNKDSKPLLKLKLKTSFLENQSSWVSQGDDEKSSSVKGQRSKRKRKSPIMDKASAVEDGKALPRFGENEKVDANWFLQKLGKDAIGKRVEVHQPSDDTWHKGMVEDIEGTSTVTIALDDGTTKHFELGKQGIRFVSQKQKRSTTRS